MAEEYEVVEINPGMTVTEIENQLNVLGLAGDEFILRGVIDATKFRKAIAILSKTV